MGLQRYRQKRDFSRTNEPRGRQARSGKALTFAIQRHHATRLHYDFRLEMEGVLASWAVPKGPSLDPKEKRLAVHVEDHPLDYGGFEGTIPKGNYGAGEVVLWDRGTWVPDGDPIEGVKKGRLKFRLDGEKLKGGWMLVRMGAPAADGKENWLLIKEKDEAAVPASKGEITVKRPESVLGKRPKKPRIWKSNRPAARVAPAPRPAASRRRGLAAAVDPSGIQGAHRAQLPDFVEPELAQLVERPPDGEDWIHEIKLDGYRLLARIEDGNVRLLTRRGLDWTARFGTVARALQTIPAREALIDGEVVVVDEKGLSSFQELQNALTLEDTSRLVFFAFDLLHLDGYSLEAVPLADRKTALQSLLRNAPTALRFSDHVIGKGALLYGQACRHGLEGIISKKAKSHRRPGRGGDWLKSKCLSRQEFVIGGYTDPSGGRTAFGALVLGTYQQGRLIYAGRVGTGFTETSLQELHEKLKNLEQPTSPFASPLPPGQSRGVHWVSPKLVAEVSFTAWTRDKILRHPSFEGLREDKSPREIVPELPKSIAKSEPAPPNRGRAKPQQRRAEILSNPDKILFPGPDFTKRDLANYYDAVADWALPHLAHRPISLFRCPEGHTKFCFFQKHAKDGLPDTIKRIPLKEESGEEDYIYIEDRAGLISLVQLGVLEIHPWGSRVDNVERPDRLTIDLDPSTEIAWKRVIESAREVRDRLAELGLVSFVKTTGGKGLHVVVPLAGKQEWGEAKDFCQAFAERMVRDEPGAYVSKVSKAVRKGKILVDWLRNARGATAVGAYSTRARAGAPVSVPLSWEELSPRVTSDEWNLRTLPRRLAVLKKDPWRDVGKLRQVLSKKMIDAVTR